MPNHVINEVSFQDLSDAQVAEILAKTTDAKGHVDFSILLPVPINCWMGSVGIRHEKAFQNNALDWCRENWGTKWNAYGAHNGTERTDSSIYGQFNLTLRFDSAWRPPYGWLAALLNTFRLSFTHAWLSEGEPYGYVGRFDYLPGNAWEEFKWNEIPAPDTMQRHLHVLRWGVERFEEDG
jgi:hypothetical protein